MAKPKPATRPKAAPKTAPKTAGADVALVHSPTEDGKGARILRLRDGELSAGEIRPVVEGQPLAGRELVRLHGREEQPGVCDVEVLHDGAAGATEGGRASGPARVSSDAYRRGWGQVFANDKTPPKGDGPDRSLN